MNGVRNGYSSSMVVSEKSCIQALCLGKKNPKYQYTISYDGNVSILEETVCEKDLGVYIDPNLNFEKHVNYVHSFFFYKNKGFTFFGKVRPIKKN